MSRTVIPNRILLATSLFKIVHHNSFRIIEGIVKIVLSIILIGKFGVLGVVIASILSSLAFSNFALNMLAGEVLKRVEFKSILLNISVLVFWTLHFFELELKILLAIFLLLFYCFIGRVNLLVLFNKIGFKPKKNCIK
jgi:hypothetical protein